MKETVVTLLEKKINILLKICSLYSSTVADTEFLRKAPCAENKFLITYKSCSRSIKAKLKWKPSVTVLSLYLCNFRIVLFHSKTLSSEKKASSEKPQFLEFYWQTSFSTSSKYTFPNRLSHHNGLTLPEYL